VFMVVFFVLTAVASMGAMLSLLEVPIALLNERFKMSRPVATWTTMGLLALVGSTCALSNSSMSGFKLFGMTMFDLFDFMTSNIMLPVGGIGLCLFTGWVWGFGRFKAELSNQGALANGGLLKTLFWVARIVSPLLILVVLLKGLKLF